MFKIEGHGLPFAGTGSAFSGIQTREITAEDGGHVVQTGHLLFSASTSGSGSIL
ncbi:MAG TPA: hypothetical protein VGC68_12345 [Enterovirga sp.]